MLALIVLADEADDLMFIMPSAMLCLDNLLCTCWRVSARKGLLKVWSKFFTLLLRDFEAIPSSFRTV